MNILCTAIGVSLALALIALLLGTMVGIEERESHSEALRHQLENCDAIQVC